MAQLDLNGQELQSIIKTVKAPQASGKKQRVSVVKGKQYSEDQAELNYSRVTIDQILKFVSHPFFEIKQTYLKSQIFNGIPEITILNPNLDVDDKLTKIARVMAETMVDPESLTPKPLYIYMQQAFPDLFQGGAAIYEPIWVQSPQSGWWMLGGMKHLEWNSMRYLPLDGNYTAYCKYLNGITYNPESGKIEYWQTQSGKPVLIPNTLHIKDPSSPDLAGIPLCIPLIGLLELMEYLIKHMRMKAQRIGAPALLIKMLDDTDETVEDATTIAQNWGSVFQFAFGGNLDLIPQNYSDNQTIENQIELVEKIIDRLWNPASQLDKSGTLIGGSDKGGHRLINSMINDMIDWLSIQFSVLFQRWLQINGFEGYIARLQLPHAEIDASELNIDKARAGFDTKSVARDERRKLLGLDAANEETIKQLQDEFSQPELGMFQNTALPKGNYDKDSNRVNSGGWIERNLLEIEDDYETEIKRLLGL